MYSLRKQIVLIFVIFGHGPFVCMVPSPPPLIVPPHPHIEQINGWGGGGLNAERQYAFVWLLKVII